ncbi:MAG: biotin carboxyl carrier protein [Hyphomicrobiaceae bacterium]|jgi:biotin carboxyl carrier protein
MQSFWRIGNRDIEVEIEQQDGRTIVRADEFVFELESVESEPGFIVVEIDGQRLRVAIGGDRGHTLLALDGVSYEVVAAEEAAAEESGNSGAFTPEITAPMPGKVLDVVVQAGDEVEADGALLVLEAMKMEQTVRAPARARVVSVAVTAGMMIGPGDLLLVLEAIDSDEPEAPEGQLAEPSS